MLHGSAQKTVGAAIVALSICNAAPPSRAESDLAAAPGPAAIARHCERCHPPLPGGGWEVMTQRAHDREELAFLLRRMAEEYAAFPNDDEKAAIIDYLGGST